MTQGERFKKKSFCNIEFIKQAINRKGNAHAINFNSPYLLPLVKIFFVRFEHKVNNNRCLLFGTKVKTYFFEFIHSSCVYVYLIHLA